MTRIADMTYEQRVAHRKERFVPTAILTSDGRSVPMADAGSVSIFQIQKVLWADGTSSWAKGWSFSHGYPEHLQGKTCRIGAGSSGDMLVWQHPEVR